MEQVVEDLSTLKLPIGWNGEETERRELFDWGRMIVGWLVTGLAGALGAPFWFNILDRLVSIRGAGAPPKRPEKT